LVNLMMGEEVGELYYKEKVPIGEEVLELKSVSLEPHFKNVNLKLRQGQIVGLYGLESAVHKELMESIFGLNKGMSGEFYLNNEKENIKSPQDAISKRIAYVPADSKISGGVLSLSVTENLVMVDNAMKPFMGLQ